MNEKKSFKKKISTFRCFDNASNDIKGIPEIKLNRKHKSTRLRKKAKWETAKITPHGPKRKLEPAKHCDNMYSLAHAAAAAVFVCSLYAWQTHTNTLITSLVCSFASNWAPRCELTVIIWCTCVYRSVQFLYLVVVATAAAAADAAATRWSLFACCKTATV